MKRYLLLFCFVMGSVYAAPKMHVPVPMRQSNVPTGAKVRVLLHENIKAGLLEVKGPYKVVSNDDKKALSIGNQGKRYVIHPIHEGLRWGEEFPDTKWITIIPTSKETDIFLNGFQYEGILHVYLTPKKQLTFVNELPVERMLLSTLAIDEYPFQHTAAKEAYAILQRTRVVESLYQSEMPWDVCAKEVGYFGKGVTRQQKGLEQAVEFTPYMVLNHYQNIPNSKIKEFAAMGLDARGLLNCLIPQAELGITINKEELTVR